MLSAAKDKIKAPKVENCIMLSNGQLATADSSERVNLLDGKTGELLSFIDPKKFIFCMVEIAPGKIALGHMNGVSIWDVTTQQKLEERLCAAMDSISVLIATPRSELIAMNGKNTWIWDWQGNLIFSMPIGFDLLDAWVKPIMFGTDWLLVQSLKSNQLQFINISSNEKFSVKLSSSIRSISEFPGDRLLILHHDGSLCLYKIDIQKKTMSQQRKIKGPIITKAIALPDGKHFIAEGHDFTKTPCVSRLELWNIHQIKYMNKKELSGDSLFFYDKNTSKVICVDKSTNEISFFPIAPMERFCEQAKVVATQVVAAIDEQVLLKDLKRVFAEYDAEDRVRLGLFTPPPSTPVAALPPAGSLGQQQQLKKS